MSESDPTEQSATAVLTRPAARGNGPRGVVIINAERCKGCGFCTRYCPTGVLEMGLTFNLKGYHTPDVVHPEKCSGCDLCGMFCPDFAIHGLKLPKPQN